MSGTKSINFTEINLGLVFDGVNTGNGAYLMIKEVNDAWMTIYIILRNGYLFQVITDVNIIQFMFILCILRQC